MHEDVLLELSEMIDDLERLLSAFTTTSFMYYDEQLHNDIMVLTKNIFITIKDSNLEKTTKEVLYANVNVLYKEAMEDLEDIKRRKDFLELEELNNGE